MAGAFSDCGNPVPRPLRLLLGLFSDETYMCTWRTWGRCILCNKRVPDLQPSASGVSPDRRDQPPRFLPSQVLPHPAGLLCGDCGNLRSRFVEDLTRELYRPAELPIVLQELQTIGNGSLW